MFPKPFLNSFESGVRLRTCRTARTYSIRTRNLKPALSAVKRNLNCTISLFLTLNQCLQEKSICNFPYLHYVLLNQHRFIAHVVVLTTIDVFLNSQLLAPMLSKWLHMILKVAFAIDRK
jgi:hypothetical protein